MASTRKRGGIVHTAEISDRAKWSKEFDDVIRGVSHRNVHNLDLRKPAIPRFPGVGTLGLFLALPPFSSILLPGRILVRLLRMGGCRLRRRSRTSLHDWHRDWCWGRSWVW